MLIFSLFRVMRKMGSENFFDCNSPCDRHLICDHRRLCDLESSAASQIALLSSGLGFQMAA